MKNLSRGFTRIQMPGGKRFGPQSKPGSFFEINHLPIKRNGLKEKFCAFLDPLIGSSTTAFPGTQLMPLGFFNESPNSRSSLDDDSTKRGGIWMNLK
jgi:hypothetical protein